MERRTPGESPLDYDAWVEDALRGVTRRALAHVAESELPGEHHFSVTFLTGAPGVRISAHLKARYSSEMTVVLQNRFDDLVVEAEAFEVTLTFGGVNARLRIPFAAVTSFADPSVDFLLKLKQPPGTEISLAGEREASHPPKREGAPEPDSAGPARKPLVPVPVKDPADGGAEPNEAKEDGSAEGATGEIIAFDKFRKK